MSLIALQLGYEEVTGIKRRALVMEEPTLRIERMTNKEA